MKTCKQYLALILFLFCTFPFISANIYAQGWQWGRNVTHFPGGMGEILANTIVDKYGNVVSTGYVSGDSVLFGSNWLSCDSGAYLEQLFITKLVLS